MVTYTSEFQFFLRFYGQRVVDIDIIVIVSSRRPHLCRFCLCLNLCVLLLVAAENVWTIRFSIYLMEKS